MGKTQRVCPCCFDKFSQMSNAKKHHSMHKACQTKHTDQDYIIKEGQGDVSFEKLPNRGSLSSQNMGLAANDLRLNNQNPVNRAKSASKRNTRQNKTSLSTATSLTQKTQIPQAHITPRNLKNSQNDVSVFGRSYQVQQTKNQDGWDSLSKFSANIFRTCEHNDSQKESLQDEGNSQFYGESGQRDDHENAHFNDNEMDMKMKLLHNLPLSLLQHLLQQSTKSASCSSNSQPLPSIDIGSANSAGEFTVGRLLDIIQEKDKQIEHLRIDLNKAIDPHRHCDEIIAGLRKQVTEGKEQTLLLRTQRNEMAEALRKRAMSDSQSQQSCTQEQKNEGLPFYSQNCISMDEGEVPLEGKLKQLEKIMKLDHIDMYCSTSHIDTKTLPETVCVTYSDLSVKGFAAILDALTSQQDEYYKLDRNSKFMDIGCGLGKCVYQTALTIRCKSQGIEYDDKKVFAAAQTRVEYERKYGIEPLFDLVDLKQGDVTNLKTFDPYTHLYSYNPTWPSAVMEPLIQVLNRTNFRVLVWAKAPKDCKALTNIKKIGEILCKNVGGDREQFYIYHKEQQQCEGCGYTDFSSNYHLNKCPKQKLLQEYDLRAKRVIEEGSAKLKKQEQAKQLVIDDFQTFDDFTKQFEWNGKGFTNEVIKSTKHTMLKDPNTHQQQTAEMCQMSWMQLTEGVTQGVAMNDGSVVFGTMSTVPNIKNMKNKGREGEVYNIDPVLEHTFATRKHLTNKGRGKSNRHWTNQQNLEQEGRIAKLKKSGHWNNRKRTLVRAGIDVQVRLQPRAQRKRSQKRMMKLSLAQETKRVTYSENIINKLLRQFKSSILTVNDIFKPLGEMHTRAKFEFVSDLFCDGFSLTDVVFDNFKDFVSFFGQRDIQVYVTQRSWRTRKDLDQKKNKHYFIRLKDENASIDE